MTDNTGGKFTRETACLSASKAQSLMSVDAGLIDSEVQWCACVCACFGLLLETWGHIDVAGRVLSPKQGVAHWA